MSQPSDPENFSPEDTIRFLTPDATRFLASMFEESGDNFNEAIRAVPFGSRAAMEDLGLIALAGDEPNQQYTMTANGLDLAFYAQSILPPAEEA